MGSCHSFPYPMQLPIVALLGSLLNAQCLLLSMCFSLSETNQPLTISSSNASAISISFYFLWISFSSLELPISQFFVVWFVFFFSSFRIYNTLSLDGSVYMCVCVRITINYVWTNMRRIRKRKRTEILLVGEQSGERTTMTTTDT